LKNARAGVRMRRCHGGSVGGGSEESNERGEGIDVDTEEAGATYDLCRSRRCHRGRRVYGELAVQVCRRSCNDTGGRGDAGVPESGCARRSGEPAGPAAPMPA
jgi:hypothetical protein